ncbi:MAG TPA: adenylate/guanylate cyclase domain-containing protein, partial [Rhodanobacteraceae bacterium]|nr:adenylate/guanylate cyclase domain-containing protein [Rhodanobacteraceae bacterium]
MTRLGAVVKAMAQPWRKLAAGVLVGALCSALLWVPQMRELEQDTGLQWLFRLRGPLEPPKNVVLVTMSHEAADQLHLPRDPEKYHHCTDLRVGTEANGYESLSPIPARWPRCLHALLIDKLHRAGARMIVFDVLFRQRAAQAGVRGDINAEQDAVLAGAMEAAGNVVIAQKFEQDRAVALSPSIERAALGAGPFELVPARSRRIDHQRVFGDDDRAPGLAMVALQAYAMEDYPAFREMLAQASTDAADLLPATAAELRKNGPLQSTGLLLRQIFIRNPALAGQLRDVAANAPAGQVQRRLIDALVAAYGGEASRMLNFVGAAGRVQAVGFDRVLALREPMPDSDRQHFADKVVFIGYAESMQPEQIEHFSTVFSGADGVDLSGVEIAATAFLNLLEDSSIRPAPAWCSALIVFVAGLAATVLCLLLNLRLAIPLVLALGAGYLVLAVQLFGSGHLWLPIVAPLLVSSPTGMAYATVRKYVEARWQCDKVRAAFRFFVPSDVADEMERNAGRIAATRRSIECVCVATDAARFTTLAESMESEALTDFLNEYFDSLFKPVIEHGGFVSDVVGDAMLAIWPDRGSETRRGVCSALLEMRAAADEFNRRAAGDRLVTRFGANRGRVTLATVGARA